ncbi:MAG TPA: hypothetical protein VNY08_21515 [Bradyrhizobium sp.]|jgi:hypothetical protein|nr:hypothetical protein [Bradyrhizobium sp.]
MGRFESAVAATLVMFFQLTSPVSFGRAAPLVLAQADKPAAPDATPSPSQAAATPGSPTSAPAKKTALSTPACSLRFLEAKVAGKLSGRTWADFRRDECGEKETTAVFPTAISPKYSNEKDIDKARKQTCADQFTANKASNANGGLKWIEKEGGYYGECVSRLKG